MAEMKFHPDGESEPIVLREAIGDLPVEMVPGIAHVWLDEEPLATKGWFRVKAMRPGERWGEQGPFRLRWDEVARTLTTGGNAGKPYLGNSHCHPIFHRTLSTREMARISSFPDGFTFIDALTSGHKRLGNSVPPFLMRAIANNLRTILHLPLMTTPTKRLRYVDLLNEAWEQHLAPRSDDAPTVISTFAGCGGSSLGYSMAGFRELLAVEWDDNAVETFKANFPDVPVFHGDIHDLTVDEVLERTGLKPGELDVFDGSPPCQGFSTAGKRDENDGRNQLFREYIRLLRGLQPKVFVMENVSGMVKGKMKLIFVEILRELKASGYTVSVRLMNAKYFNVPQSRERLIFVGVRNDIAEDFKTPFHHPKGEGSFITAGDAVVGAEVIGCPPLDDDYGKLWDRVPLGGSAEDVLGKGRGWNGCVKLDPRKPAPTLMKMQGGAGFGTMVSWIERRAISIGEAKRLHSFPDAMQFPGSYVEAWARIGNSVPPLLMRSIAEAIKKGVIQWKM